MRSLAAAMLVLLAACGDATGPHNTARQQSGWWYVTLANGAVCIARPYQVPGRDTAREAIAECRSVSP